MILAPITSFDPLSLVVGIQEGGGLQNLSILIYFASNCGGFFFSIFLKRINIK